MKLINDVRYFRNFLATILHIIWISSQFLRDSKKHTIYTIGNMYTLKLLSKAIFVFFFPAAFIFYNVGPIFGFVSSGNDYIMESSNLVSGGELASGGEYTSKGALSQIHLPADAGTSAGEYVNRVGFYNPPYFTYQRGLPIQLSFDSGNVELVLPANSVDKSAFDISINKDAVANPVITDSAKITNANLKMETNEGAWSRLYSGNISEMVVFDEQSFWTESFSSDGLLAMSYDDVDNDGILDGSNPPVRVNTLQAWALDDERSMWVKMPSANLDTGLKKIMVPCSSPGVYVLLGQVEDSVKDVYAYPVPFRPNGPNAGIGAGKTGTEAMGIIFTNVPDVGNIEIYTIDGRLVKKIAIPSNLNPAILTWDVKNENGTKAASGVYIWRVVSGDNSKTGKLMVIR